MSMHAFSKTSTGSESGTVTLSGFTSGTKGEASISQYGPTTPGNTLSTPANTKGSDTNTSSLAIAITGAASFTTQVGDIIVCHVGIITTAATYTASATGPAIAQTGATLTNTARYSGRDTATNTVYYGHIDAAVTVGASAAPSYSATAVGTGANAAGSGAFVLIRETAATAPALPIIVLAPRR